MRGVFVIVLLALWINLQCVLQSNSSDTLFRPKNERHFDLNQYVNLSLNNNNVQSTKRKPKCLVALIFSNKTRNNVALPPSNVGNLAACGWLKGYKKQMQQCLDRRGFAKVLQDARKLAVTHCRNLFSYDRWDCTKLHNSMFKKVYRETSFMQAITASALMFSVAKACSDGKLQSCYCLVRPKRENSKWHGVGCADNTKVARRITRKFLIDNNQFAQNGSKFKLKQEIYRNNINIGLETVDQHKKDVCVCHGVSASCTLKTCWKIINRNFTTIALSLKTKYSSAVFYKQNWIHGQDKEQNNLIYLEPSPNYCDSTRGRRCKDHNHCATLCCGRGSLEKNVIVNGHCHCKWNDGLVLGCELCKINEVHFICK